MERIIKSLVLILNILCWIIVDIYLWSLAWSWGISGIVGIVGFFIGYSSSHFMEIAPRDHYRMSGYEVFKKKLIYGNSIGGSFTGTAGIIFLIAQIMIESY